MGPDGYTAGDWNCVGEGTFDGDLDTIALALGESATCTIENVADTAHLTLVKVVNNDAGGTALATAWTLSADGPTPISGAGGVDSDVNAGTYALSESVGPDGYTAGDWNCVGEGTFDGDLDTIALALGESATCTIENVADTAHLTLVKVVNNDNGGDALATAWTLTADGPTPISGAGGVDSDVNAGTYALSESVGPDGYTAGDWNCVGEGTFDGDLDTIALALGESATCTIINNDIGPKLTLVKEVTNNDGGTGVAEIGR